MLVSFLLVVIAVDCYLRLIDWLVTCEFSVAVVMLLFYVDCACYCLLVFLLVRFN